MSHSGVALPRFVLDAARSGGTDPQRLIRDARFPGWLLGREQVRVPAGDTLRLWEPAAWHTGALDTVGLRIGACHRTGVLDLHDYLFTSAATLGEALRVHNHYLPVLTLSAEFEVTETDTELILRYVLRAGRTPAVDLSVQFAVAVTCQRISRPRDKDLACNYGLIRA